MFRNFLYALFMVNVWRAMGVGEYATFILAFFINALSSGLRILTPLALAKGVELIAQADGGNGLDEKYTVPWIDVTVTAKNLFTIYLVFLAAEKLFTPIAQISTVRLENKVSKHYRERLIQKMHQVSYRDHGLHIKNNFDTIFSQADQYAKMVPKTFIHRTLPSIFDFSLAIAIIAYNYGWSYSLLFGLYPAAYFSTIGVLDFVKGINIIHIAGLETRATFKLLRQLSSAIHNMETVRALSHEPYERSSSIQLLSGVNHLVRRGFYTEHLWSFFNNIPVIGVHIGVVLLIIKGGFFEVEISDLLFMLSYASMLSSNTGAWYTQIKLSTLATQNLRAGLRTLVDELDETNTIDDNHADVNMAQILLNEPLVFDHVSFEHEPGHQVLEDINFTIPAGQKVAFVGQSGAGKSTIMKLLFRFYRPTGGTIQFGQHDIQDLPLGVYRRHFGYIPQDVQLFYECSTPYNMAYGIADGTLLRRLKERAFVPPPPPPADNGDDGQEHGAPGDEVVIPLQELPYEEPAELTDANIEDYIRNKAQRARLENRFYAQPMELSDGERKRVGVARLLGMFPPPRILVLDEPTTSLDPITAQQVTVQMNALAEPVGEEPAKRSICVSHNLQSIVNVHTIFVLRQGRLLAGSAPHAELMQADNQSESAVHYRELWQAQQM